jgi:hypothetical protein
VSCFLCGARVHSCVVEEYVVVVFLLSVSVSCLSLSLVSSEKNFNNTHTYQLSLSLLIIRNLSLFLLIHRANTQHNATLELSRAGAHFLPRISFLSAFLHHGGFFLAKEFFPRAASRRIFCIILSKILLFFRSRENLVFARDATRVFVFVTSLCVFHFRLWEWKQSQSELILTRSRNIRHLAALQNRRYPRRRRLFYFLA